jgi:gamma-glutamyl-gamma-aminobutyrate hydrolase PuuD
MNKVIGLPIGLTPEKLSINRAYVDFIVGAGFIPRIISPIQEKTLEQMEGIDGLLLPGGIDLDPIYYGVDNFDSFNVNPEKDIFERSLFHFASENGIKIFGICRGFQLIMREVIANTPFGKKEFEYWQDVNYHAQPAELQAERFVRTHYVQMRPDLMYGNRDAEPVKMAVNSMHHQCVICYELEQNFAAAKTKSPIRHVKIAAWCGRGLKNPKTTRSAVIEGVRINKALFGSEILAVQWHPEELKDYALIKNFFDESTGEKDGKKHRPEVQGPDVLQTSKA